MSKFSALLRRCLAKYHGCGQPSYYMPGRVDCVIFIFHYDVFLVKLMALGLGVARCGFGGPF